MDERNEFVSQENVGEWGLCSVVADGNQNSCSGNDTGLGEGEASC